MIAELSHLEIFLWSSWRNEEQEINMEEVKTKVDKINETLGALFGQDKYCQKTIT